HAAEVVGEELQGAVGQFLHLLLAEQALRQLGLAAAQPGALALFLGVVGLLGHGDRIGARQVQQLAAAEQGQQAAEQDADQQIGAGAPGGGGADLGAALLAQVALGADEVVQLAAHAVREALAAAATHLLEEVAATAAAADHLL